MGADFFFLAHLYLNSERGFLKPKMRLSSSSPSPRQHSSRRSSLKFNGRIPLNQLVDDWEVEHCKSNRAQIEDLKSLFKSSVNLQDISKNLVFFDRGLREVKEFP